MPSNDSDSLRVNELYFYVTMTFARMKQMSGLQHRCEVCRVCPVIEITMHLEMTAVYGSVKQDIS